MTFSKLQTRIVAHAASIMLIAMLAGVGLLISVVGGLEVWPGHVLGIDLQSSPAGWVRAHVGGLLNAMLLMLIALLIPGLAFSERASQRIALAMIATGWVNTLFYWAALWAPNRALTFGDNRLGASNWLAVIGLAPALLGVGLSLAAVGAIALKAWRAQ